MLCGNWRRRSVFLIVRLFGLRVRRRNIGKLLSIINRICVFNRRLLLRFNKSMSMSWLSMLRLLRFCKIFG